MKNYLVYYQHYVNSHRHWKFKMLRSKYGWTGEGKFWALNNMINSSDDATMDISRKAVIVSVADELDMQIEEFREFVEFLSRDCELLTFVDHQIFTEIGRDNLKEVMKKRKRGRSNKNNDLEENCQQKTESYLQFIKN